MAYRAAVDRVGGWLGDALEASGQWVVVGVCGLSLLRYPRSSPHSPGRHYPCWVCPPAGWDRITHRVRVSRDAPMTAMMRASFIYNVFLLVGLAGAQFAAATKPMYQEYAAVVGQNILDLATHQFAS